MQQVFMALSAKGKLVFIYWVLEVTAMEAGTLYTVLHYAKIEILKPEGV